MVEEVTIAQEPVNMDENSDPNVNNSLETLNNEADPEPVEEALPDEITKLPEEPAPKRKPGRPLGAKSKQPGKPRAPRAKKVEIVEEPVVQDMPFGPGQGPVEEVPAYEEAPRVLSSQPIPTEARNDRDAKMLRLLQEHSMNRRQRKVAMWKSWFQ